MKTAVDAFAALLLAGALYPQPAAAQVEVQPGPGFSVQIDPWSAAPSGAAERMARA